MINHAVLECRVSKDNPKILVESKCSVWQQFRHSALWKSAGARRGATKEESARKEENSEIAREIKNVSREQV